MDARQSSDLLGRLAALGLDTEAGLCYTAGDADLYHMVLASFVRDSAGRNERLAQALAAQDWDTYRIQAHALKGAARTIGANDLADVAFGQECASREQRADAVVAGHLPMIDAYATLERALAGVLGIEAPVLQAEEELPSSGELDAATYAAVLRKACAHMDAFEVEEARDTLHSAEKCTYEGRTLAELCATIQGDLETFEVDAALAKTRRLMDELGA
jgi:HPt (histidine-containing phosphotransfer) domain-containing protein